MLDYEGFEFAPPVKRAFVDFVRNGGGLVVIHAADNAFPAWPEFNEMIGVGGWGGFTPGYESRTVAAGPKVRWRDGRTVLDHETPGVAQHPSPHDFVMTVRTPDHPIVKGLPAEWLHAKDELYSNLRGPARNVTVLVTATAPTTMQNGTGENEPLIMAIDYGRGRVFHDTLGHVGPTQTELVIPMNSVDFITLLPARYRMGGDRPCHDSSAARLPVGRQNVDQVNRDGPHSHRARVEPCQVFSVAVLVSRWGFPAGRHREPQ